MMKTPEKSGREFEKQARLGRGSILSEYFHFIATDRKWWMVPILMVLVFVGLLVMLGGSIVAPVIYMLF